MTKESNKFDPRDSARKGNASEYFVASVLSRYCLVRPVANGTDVGIDLYCETLDEQNRPLFHFWVQVKGINRSRVTGTSWKEVRSSTNISKERVSYLCSQPVPAFVIVAPFKTVERSLEFGPELMVFSPFLESNLGNELRLVEGVFTSFNINLADDRFLYEFIYRKIPIITSLNMLQHGVLPSVRWSNEEYTKSFPVIGALSNSARLSETIKHNCMSVLFSLLESILLPSKPDESMIETALHFGKILKTFEDQNHWDSCVALAIYERSQLNFDEAKRLIEKSIELIGNDEKFQKEVVHWQALIDFQKNLIEQIDSAAERLRK